MKTCYDKRLKAWNKCETCESIESCSMLTLFGITKPDVRVIS